jgi:hypothetical protein
VAVYEADGSVAVGVTHTDASGHYEVGELEPGKYKVQFSADDYATQFYEEKASLAPATEVTVVRGRTVEDVNARLTPTTGCIAGRVTDSDGSELHGIQVVVYEGTKPVAVEETGTDGGYKVTGLPVGSYKVEFSAGPLAIGVAYLPQFWNGKTDLGEAESVSVAAGATHAGIDAELQRSGSISGTVSAETTAGGGLGGVTVTVYEGATEAATATSGPNGDYVIGGLPPGEYKVGFSPTSGLGYQSGFYGGASLDAAKQVKVEPETAAKSIDAALLPQAPTATAPPTITGEAKQSQALTEHHGTWGNGPESYGYQWRRCDAGGNGCSPISGATGQTYMLTAADVGHAIRVTETATNKGGSSVDESAPTAAVAAPPGGGSSGGGTPGGGSSSGGGSSGSGSSGGGSGGSGTPGQPGTPSSKRGVAVATGTATVKGNAAQVALRCTGEGACSGVVELTVKVRSKHGGHGHAKTQTMVLGQVHFSIAAGGHATVRVILSGQGQKMVKKASHGGLKARVEGSGVRSGTIKLKGSAGHGGGKHHHG